MIPIKFPLCFKSEDEKTVFERMANKTVKELLLDGCEQVNLEIKWDGTAYDAFKMIKILGEENIKIYEDGSIEVRIPSCKILQPGDHFIVKLRA